MHLSAGYTIIVARRGARDVRPTLAEGPALNPPPNLAGVFFFGAATRPSQIAVQPTPPNPEKGFGGLCRYDDSSSDFDNPVWPTSMLTFGPPLFR
jgi:hypothetical protein